jgi:hypothetical protein
LRLRELETSVALLSNQLKLSLIAGIAFLVSCSDATTISSAPIIAQLSARFPIGHEQSSFNRFGELTYDLGSRPRVIGHDNCPSSGPLEYVSDYTYDLVDIYAGNFAGRPPCGQITAGITFPLGVFVKADTHDLYVCNGVIGVYNILVFRRGQITPYNGYTDPSTNLISDVTVADDGTVVASNAFKVEHPGPGSISTWIESPTGGTFIGNFPTKNGGAGSGITVTKNGVIYYEALDALRDVTVWTVSCPKGACGPQAEVAAGTLFSNGFAGIKADAEGDILINDFVALTADTFELPNRIPKTFPLTGSPSGLAIDEHDHHWFIADPINDDAAEYLYPSGALVGTVTDSPRGEMVDIAVDP